MNTIGMEILRSIDGPKALFALKPAAQAEAFSAMGGDAALVLYAAARLAETAVSKVVGDAAEPPEETEDADTEQAFLNGCEITRCEIGLSLAECLTALRAAVAAAERGSPVPVQAPAPKPAAAHAPMSVAIVRLAGCDWRAFELWRVVTLPDGSRWRVCQAEPNGGRPAVRYSTKGEARRAQRTGAALLGMPALAGIWETRTGQLSGLLFPAEAGR